MGDEPHDEANDEAIRADRRAAWVIFLITFACYAFFFAGPDWNSMSHFATIRAIVEHHTADISRYTDVTGDISVFQNGTFSSKPPGLALLGIVPYFVLIHVERWFGVDIDAPRVWHINLHLMAMLLSAAPAAGLNVLVYGAFRREGASSRAALLLAGGFAFGGLSWPYAGTLMAHLLCAFLIFAAWMLVTSLLAASRIVGAESVDLRNRKRYERSAAMAGVLCAVSILCDLLTIPVCAILAMYLLARRASRRACFGFCLGPAGGLLLLLLFNRLVHGHALDAAPLHPTGEFTRPGLLFGLLDWPQWIRLYWITLHPMRGLLWCCPMFVVPLTSALLIRRPIRIRLDRAMILLILATYIAFYLCYLTWTGGWGVGLRFMIPALPLVWLFSLWPARRFPKFSGAMIAWSIFNMLSITAVNPMFPAPNSGPPNDTDPVAVCRTHFLFGELNQSKDSHNLASMVGITGAKQLLPVYTLMALYVAYALRTKARADR